MKKAYINPTMEIIDIEPAQMIAESISVGDDEYNEETNGPQLSRRSSLWDD